eukprot:1317412-Amphidinium_carterae.1
MMFTAESSDRSASQCPNPTEWAVRKMWIARASGDAACPCDVTISAHELPSSGNGQAFCKRFRIRQTSSKRFRLA